MEGQRLIFIDESAAKTSMTRLYGRCPKSERLHASAPHGHWCTTTMIGALRSDVSTARVTIGGATNTEVFQAYVREILCPTLRPGDTVIMDNLRAHKNERTVALIEQIGARALFLPAYSPDLNPIELMWSKVKTQLRAAQARPPREPTGGHWQGPRRSQRPGCSKLMRTLRLYFYLKCAGSKTSAF